MHMHATPQGTGRMQRVLQVSLVLTFAYVLVTFFAGLHAHSLALISEAGHNVSDFLALALSFVAVHFQTRPATPEKTFGYQRAGVLAAFVNAVTLVLLAIWIAAAAIHRLSAPVAVAPEMMMIVAAIGVLMNGIIAALLWKCASDVNIRSVFLHMLGDTLSTAAVIAGGAGIYFTKMYWIDPVLSLGIAGMVLWSAVGVVRETLNILLEGTPRGLRLAVVREAMLDVGGVRGVHDLHVWSLGSNSHALASHILVEDAPVSDCAEILERVNGTLRDRFHIHHTTIQMEIVGCETVHGCSAPPELEEVTGHAHHHHGHDHAH
jgi:cobalt-zinc-cadmium efflux system protein